MNKKYIKFFAISAVTLFLLYFLSLRACVESNFLLSPESRLPKWITLPDGYSRGDVTVSLFLYNGPYARVIVRGPAPTRTKLMDELIRANWHSVTVEEQRKRRSYDFSPQYYYAEYKGIKDVITFPCEGPVFWMTDTIDTNTTNKHTECPPIDDSLIGNPW